MTDDKKEKEVSWPGPPDTSLGDACVDNPSSTPIITQDDDKGQAGVSLSRFEKKRKNRHALHIESKVAACAIKCYDEQLEYGRDYTFDKIRNFDKKYHIIAIVHDRDEVADGIWQTSKVKPHLHIIFRCIDRKDRYRVKKLLDDLGIVFRRGIDDELWNNGGVETIGTFTGYAVYLTHETEDAIRDAKERYELDELISNLTLDEIIEVREGYTSLDNGKRKVAMDELIALDKEAYDLGYDMGSFDKWYGSQPFVVRSHSKKKTIVESYERGVNDRLEKNPEIVRACIFIHGMPNAGKTYASKAALSDKPYLCIQGGGSGKFDNLRPDHEAIIIDDDICPNLLNMSDNYICRAYRRNSNNPVWAGKYLIVTSNLYFPEWVEACKIKVTENTTPISHYDYMSRANQTDVSLPTKRYEAVLSRFFVCRISYDDKTGSPSLLCEHVSERGSCAAQEKRRDLYRDFCLKFNDTIRQYKSDPGVVDYSDIIGIPAHFEEVDVPQSYPGAAQCFSATGNVRWYVMKSVPAFNPMDK